MYYLFNIKKKYLRFLGNYVRRLVLYELEVFNLFLILQILIGILEVIIRIDEIEYKYKFGILLVVTIFFCLFEIFMYFSGLNIFFWKGLFVELGLKVSWRNGLF